MIHPKIYFLLVLNSLEDGLRTNPLPVLLPPVFAGIFDFSTPVRLLLLDNVVLVSRTDTSNVR